MWYKMNPTDVLVFKNSTAYNKGENVVAKTQFPPYPSVYTGALRTFYFAHHMGDFDRAGTEEDITANICLGFSGICIEKKMYLPMPLDTVYVEENETRKAYVLKYEPFDTLSNYPCKYVLVDKTNKEIENMPQGSLITIEDLEAYLEGNHKTPISYNNIGEMIGIENKIGIGISKKTGSAEKGLLYHLEMVRPTTYKIKREEKVEIIVEANQLQLPQKGLLKLGGEAKVVSIKSIEDPLKKRLEIIPSNNYFKLYFATPSIFQGGYLPNWIDKKTMEGTYKGIMLKLMCAAVGRGGTITGFDIKKGKPKPMYELIPAGSVYYFEVLNEVVMEEVVKVFNKKCITDQKQNEGFGYCLVGRI